MVNFENQLTVDDLIVEYMIYKVENGYDPSFLVSEFIQFLHFFETKMEVKDFLYEDAQLFQSFFERKINHDWSTIANWATGERKIKPHMEMEYSIKHQDYLIRANYLLSNFDKSVINTYFMDNGMGKYGRGKVQKIRNIIGEYLVDYPKRKIDESIEISNDELIIGKFAAAQIVSNIWDSYRERLVALSKWPSQCRDINKFLLEMDLAEFIGVASIKKDLLEIYSVISKRIAILYHQDKNLKISSCSSSFLSVANYNLLIEGYEKTMGIAFGKFKKVLDLDLSLAIVKEKHEVDRLYRLVGDRNIVADISLQDNKVKQLVETMKIQVSKYKG